MRSEYTTRQREQILQYLKDHAQGHVTAEQLLEHLHQNGHRMGKATVYRTLERLERQNAVRRYELGGRQGACYQYIADGGCHHHFHLKCIQCGRLFHVECSLLEETSRHIGREHHFAVDPSKTVFYGRCSRCSGETDEPFHDDGRCGQSSNP